MKPTEQFTDGISKGLERIRQAMENITSDCSSLADCLAGKIAIVTPEDEEKDAVAFHDVPEGWRWPDTLLTQDNYKKCVNDFFGMENFTPEEQNAIEAGLDPYARFMLYIPKYNLYLTRAAIEYYVEHEYGINKPTDEMLVSSTIRRCTPNQKKAFLGSYRFMTRYSTLLKRKALVTSVMPYPVKKNDPDDSPSEKMFLTFMESIVGVEATYHYALGKVLNNIYDCSFSHSYESIKSAKWYLDEALELLGKLCPEVMEDSNE